MLKNILVTGANGQLGNEIREVSALSDDNYIFTDSDSLDICSFEQVSQILTENNIQVIINCAAYTNVDKAEDDEVAADLVNHVGPKNLARKSKELGIILIHVSTDYVFQGDRNIPCKEAWETFPLGVYGRTKLAGEQAIQESGCDYLIFRTAWLYSTFGNNFVKTMVRLISERTELKVVYDQIGTPTYAKDLAETIYRIVEQRQFSNSGVYHYSNEGVCSWYDFAKEIAFLIKNDTCTIYPCYSEEFPSKVKRPHFSVLAKEKVKSTFGVTVPYWKDSLERCLRNLISV